MPKPQKKRRLISARTIKMAHGRKPQHAEREAQPKNRDSKAYELLLRQPATVAGLSDRDLATVVISAISNTGGEVILVSKYTDMCWDLWPFVNIPNRVP